MCPDELYYSIWPEKIVFIEWTNMANEKDRSPLPNKSLSKATLALQNLPYIIFPPLFCLGPYYTLRFHSQIYHWLDLPESDYIFCKTIF
jgi:hypothetical protein